MAITRRHLLQGSALAAIAPALGLNSSLSAITPAFADTAPDGLKWRHGLSTYGEIRYPADFKRYDYVNPDAPEGGRGAAVPARYLSTASTSWLRV